MRKAFRVISVIFFGMVLSWTGWAQTVTTDPVFPKADEEVTFSVDVTGTSLDGYTGDVWIWTWIERGNMDIDAPTNVNPATSAQSDALMTKVSTNPDIYEITFIPVDFFNSTVQEVDQIGLKLKSRDWADNIQSDTDLFVTFSTGELQVSVTEPTVFPHFVDPSETFTISGASSEVADLSISIDDVEVATAMSATEISYMETAPASGSRTVKITAMAMGEAESISFEYIVRGNTVQEVRPAGIIDGINYDDGDASKVTLSLWAPLKSSVYVIGDFNQWEVTTDYQMKQDGEHFWLEINGLTPQTEYGYQYIVDEVITVADPYADKILDPDDPGIPSASYPNLKAYPSEALNFDWFENRVSVLQTAQVPYVWQTTSYQRPDKEDLLVYELLIRDFLGTQNGNYQTLIDTLSYIKDLGFNAIELMPVMEFNGNNSWGYNPTFMFAPDKFYGPKNELKRFIDEAHAQDMVVILDMVLNQNDVPAPYAAMYYDFNSFKPTADNPWFNVNATHPFNVFNDFNHESSYTQSFVDTVNYYWLKEYRFDGFRFDLSKGFTQTFNTDVGLWSAYDASRIAILKRMADELWSHSPDAYIILEHFADNSEEKELSDYGMMLWGNGHFDYKEAILGFGENRSIGWSYFEDRGWNNNYLISYMESHDEQRQMYEAINFGNSSGSYDVKATTTALNRLKLAAAFFFTVPGPKMIWQFGEFGYDVDINENGRTGIKPTKWEYLQDDERLKLKKVYEALIKLRDLEVFQQGTFSWAPDGNMKRISISHSSNDITIIGNFGVTNASLDPNFQTTGTWYDYFTGITIEVDNPNADFLLAPGQFHILSREPLPATEPDLVPFRPDRVTDLPDTGLGPKFQYYPNPAEGTLKVIFAKNGTQERSVVLMDNLGREIQSFQVARSLQQIEMDVSGVDQGFYILQVSEGLQQRTQKILIGE